MSKAIAYGKGERSVRCRFLLAAKKERVEIMEQEIDQRRNFWRDIALGEIILRSWWVILFALLCYGAFEAASARQNREIYRLQRLLAECRQRQRYLLLQKRDLQQTLKSTDDPAWVERVLMRELGVAPQDYRKVYFKEDVACDKVGGRP
jgi:hypothetical protein